MSAMAAFLALLLPQGAGPDVGSEAPNFIASAQGGKEKVELKKVVEKEKKPVVLVFGSKT